MPLRHYDILRLAVVEGIALRRAGLSCRAGKRRNVYCHSLLAAIPHELQYPLWLS